MTTTEVPVRLDFDSAAPAFSRAVSHLDNAATKELDRVGVEPGLADRRDQRLERDQRGDPRLGARLVRACLGPHGSKR